MINRYHRLSSQEQADLSSKTEEDHDSIDLYFSKIHSMCQQLYSELQRDELWIPEFSILYLLN